MSGTPENSPEQGKVRLDLWLWAARFYKTRSMAKAAVEGGKVELDGARTKPGRAITIGACITLTRPLYRQQVVVLALAAKRGNATIAQTLYEETASSIEARDRALAARRLNNAGLIPPSARPDSRGRRAIKNLKEHPPES